MALGRTKIEEVKNGISSINYYISEFDDCLNTFNYVVTNLSEWADETTIGSDLRDKLQKLTNAVRDTNNYTKNLVENLNNFVERQEQYNIGNYN